MTSPASYFASPANLHISWPYIGCAYKVLTTYDYDFLHQSFLTRATDDIVGTKKPGNIFRLRNVGEPNQVFNWRLWFVVLSFRLVGAARGTNEGLISGAFNSENF